MPEGCVFCGAAVCRRCERSKDCLSAEAFVARARRIASFWDVADPNQCGYCGERGQGSVCPTCQFMKRLMTHEEFLGHMQQIALNGSLAQVA